MGAISSATLYLASSLATASPAPEGDRAVPVAVDAGRGAVAPVVFDLPRPARAGPGRSLDEAIADEVRRDAAAAPASPAAPVDGADEWEDADLAHAVIALHAARIAVLRERIAAASGIAGAGARARLAVLRLQLGRAEAARRIALARADGAACARAGDLEPCRSAKGTVDALPPRIASAGARPRRARADAPAPPPSGATTPAPASMTRAAPAPSGAIAVATGARGPGPGERHRHPPRDPARTVPTGRELAASASAHRSSPASDRARHLLAAARRLLEADVAGHARAPLELAGFVHWQGSETWSLADYPRRIA